MSTGAKENGKYNYRDMSDPQIRELVNKINNRENKTAATPAELNLVLQAAVVEYDRDPERSLDLLLSLFGLILTNHRNRLPGQTLVLHYIIEGKRSETGLEIPVDIFSDGKAFTSVTVETEEGEKEVDKTDPGRLLYSSQMDRISQEFKADFDRARQTKPIEEIQIQFEISDRRV